MSALLAELRWADAELRLALRALARWSHSDVPADCVDGCDAACTMVDRYGVPFCDRHAPADAIDMENAWLLAAANECEAAK